MPSALSLKWHLLHSALIRGAPFDQVRAVQRALVLYPLWFSRLSTKRVRCVHALTTTRDDALFGLVKYVHAPLIHKGHYTVAPSRRTGRGLHQPILYPPMGLRGLRRETEGHRKRLPGEHLPSLSYFVHVLFLPVTSAAGRVVPGRSHRFTNGSPGECLLMTKDVVRASECAVCYCAPEPRGESVPGIGSRMWRGSNTYLLFTWEYRPVGQSGNKSHTTWCFSTSILRLNYRHFPVSPGRNHR